MKVAVFGAKGMLGRAVVEELADGHEAIPISHAECDVGNPTDVLLRILMAKPDAVINCAGARPGEMPGRMALANAAGPHIIAGICARRDVRFVHASTDCVFSGAPAHPERRYSVLEAPCPVDLYGRTKYAGEPGGPGVLVVRTSFIGFEHGLLRWLIDESAAGRVVPGWRRAFWTGSTVTSVARALVLLAQTRDEGIAHLATRDKVTKYHALVVARDALGLKTKITSDDSQEIDRALDPTVVLPPLELAMAELVLKWRTLVTPRRAR